MADQTTIEGDHAKARSKLGRLLGRFPRPFLTIETSERIKLDQPGIRAEKLQLRSSAGVSIRAILTGPDSEWCDRPAVLYCHAHGNRYAIGASELIEGRPALLPEPYGQALAREEFVALSVDMPCFGGRASDGEQALAKKHLYEGRTLFGQMLAELGGALDFLSRIDGIDANRLGVFGFSMGATHAFWLAALEPRIRAVAHACAFADLETLVTSGAHDLHGLYMTIPGLLKEFSTGQIAALVAPRPQLACLGLLDPLTPADAVGRAMAEVRAGYNRSNALSQFQSLIADDVGHIETDAMRGQVLGFFKSRL
jgi:pimeloyl-ACP methyl ester carboxylesterase